MKTLITGGAGFVAGHLRRELEKFGHRVVLTDVDDCDLTDSTAVCRLFDRVRPDAVCHLGAISFVPDAAKDTTLLARVNVDGTRNVVEAMARSGCGKGRGGMPTLVFVSTAQVMNTPLSAYAASKLAAEKVVLSYAKSVDAVIARPANHTGPGQSPKFVLPSFVRQAVEIKAGKRACFSVGNLDSIRDFTDVRDVVRAYRILLERGKPGEIYPIGSNARLSMRALLDLVSSASEIESVVQVNPDFWRPVDESPSLNTQAICTLGWRPEIPLRQTIEDMFSDRNKA